ncbi:hypothetical protein RHGRI_000876 [Rhododendron griersonianum]|uniref:DUF4283 domain-containing protein n=1 Tax=Rhododendron griersonianum TaxID=479676 RepID=A0AAV6LI79_9ERIC|nr:hypothetical protein RHGRI_000876 [Rhododendron griersonianum]
MKGKSSVTVPKPKLLDFLEMVTVPSSSAGELSANKQIKDLSMENSMLRKLLAEKSVSSPPPGGAWKDKVNLDSPFPKSVDLHCPDGDTVIVNIKYPWHPLKCMRCKIFGHSDDHCPAKPKPVPMVAPMEVVGTSIQAGSGGMVSSDQGLTFGSLGGIMPAVAVSPIREDNPMVVNHYTKEPKLVKTNYEKQTLVESLFPSEHDLRDIGFVTSPVVGDAFTGNRFSPLAVKETELAGGCSVPVASSSAALTEVVGEFVSGESVPSKGKAGDPPVPQVVKGRNKEKGLELKSSRAKVAWAAAFVPKKGG